MVVATIPSQHERRFQEAEQGAEMLGAQFLSLDVPVEELTLRSRADRPGRCGPGGLFTGRDLHALARRLAPRPPDHFSRGDLGHAEESLIVADVRADDSRRHRAQRFQGAVVRRHFRIHRRQGSQHHGAQSQHEVLGDGWLEGVRGRAMYRGFQINVAYAESFEVVKEIETSFQFR